MEWPYHIHQLLRRDLFRYEIVPPGRKQTFHVSKLDDTGGCSGFRRGRASRRTVERDISPANIRGDEVPIVTAGQLKDLQVLLYSGNNGVAHDSDTVVGGLIKHHSEETGIFGLWLSGIGSTAELVERQLREIGIPVAGSSRRIAAAIGYGRRSPDLTKARVFRYRPPVEGVWLALHRESRSYSSAPQF